MKAALEKTFPVLTAMHYAGKNAQAYPGGARLKPTLSAPYAARCQLLSLPLICSIDSDVFHTWATEILLPDCPRAV